MQNEIIVLNKKYKTVRVFFGGRFGGRSMHGFAWTSLDEYGISNKIEGKKNPLKPMISKVKMDFFVLLWNLPQELDGGSAEIRTLGGLPLAGFQDRCLQPLGHTSAMPKDIKVVGPVCKQENDYFSLFDLIFTKN